MHDSGGIRLVPGAAVPRDGLYLPGGGLLFQGAFRRVPLARRSGTLRLRGKFPPDGTGQDHLRPPRGHARRGVTPAAVCLAAITENPLPGCAIVGFSSLARLRDTLSDASLELSPEEVAWLWDGSADNRPVP